VSLPLSETDISMSIGLDDIGHKTAEDLNQYVHSWIDDLRCALEELVKMADSRRIKITIEIESKEKL
jgi:hypothetical protein